MQLYFRLSYILLQLVSASLLHLQLQAVLLQSLHCHLSMSRVKAFLFLILNSFEIYKSL
jgi:hypothetical protein